MTAQTAQKLSPVISLVNEQPRTMSTDVAAYFGKRHDNVMRQIQQIITNCPQEWGLLNFEETSYTDEQGRPQPCYSMTKDGFMLLAMGFTGPKAMQIKIAYIEAFSAMEAELTRQTRNTFKLTDEAEPSPLALSTVKSRAALVKWVMLWKDLCPITRSDAWQMIHARYHVAKVDELTNAQVRDAEKWVEGHLAPQIKALPAPQTLTGPHAQLVFPQLLSEKQISQAHSLYEECRQHSQKLYKALHQLAITVNCALTELSNYHTFNDVPLFEQLANLMDTHRIMLHGFNNAEFTELSRTADHCRRVVRFIETCQVNPHKKAA